ncbi:MAG TPA: polyprenol monophosphomannose synthase [Candidatus Peribacteraceae bacterium]|nr:polyprenol monophosphomannose synthase [Candidatus Peribacteraceae bacterium]
MLSLILPTYNEAKNLPELIPALEKVLAIPHEIIVVDDDSPDRTWEVAEELCKQYPVRVLRRRNHRGLSSAVVDGFAIAQGNVLAVMDSDLQHDPHILLDLYQAIQNGADIAVASRYREGGSVGEWVTGRRLLSKAGTRLAQWLPPVHSSDPMSGFFAVNSASYDRIATKLRPTGFKILLEVLAHLPPQSRIFEVPLTFLPRKHGESKLNLKVEWDFVLQILRIAVMRFAQTISFAQIPLFFVLSLIILAMLLPKVWAMRLLYTDAHMRSRVQSALTHAADQNGWLVSDLLVQSVTTDHVRVLHDEHRRGPDVVACLDLSLTSSVVTPCVK